MSTDSDDHPQVQANVDEVDLEADWVEFKDDWWKHPFTSVDWTCRRRYYWLETGDKLPVHPAPPFYHDLLYINKDDFTSVWRSQDEEGEDSLELNASLVGVKGVEDALARYETAVGIVNEDLQALNALYRPARLLYRGELTDKHILQAQLQWHLLVDPLVGGILEPSDFTLTLDTNYNTNFLDLDLNAAVSSPSINPHTTGSPDGTDSSDMSLDSDSDPPPSTPYTDKKSYAAVLFRDQSERKDSLGSNAVVSPSPSKPLNASALSFVPAYNLNLEDQNDTSPPSPTSELPYVSPTYEFHFPSLSANTSRSNSRSVPPPPSLQRDEQGFYNAVAGSSKDVSTNAMMSRSSTPKRPSAQMLPGFLTESPTAARSRSTSKTREIVDRLRSSAPGRRQRKAKGESSSLRHAADAEDADNGSAATTNVADGKSNDASDGWVMPPDVAGKEQRKSGRTGKNERAKTRKDKQEAWIQELFQCRTQGQPQAQTATQSKTKVQHERSASTATTSTTTSSSFSPTTPSSTSSHLASPATSLGSAPCIPGGFTHPFYSYMPPPYVYPPPPSYPMVPPMMASPPGMMSMQQAQWQLAMQGNVPYMGMGVLPQPPPMFVRR